MVPGDGARGMVPDGIARAARQPPRSRRTAICRNKRLVRYIAGLRRLHTIAHSAT